MNILNFKINEFENLKEGKYDAYDKINHKELLLIVNTERSFIKEKKEFIFVNKNNEDERIKETKEIELFKS